MRLLELGMTNFKSYENVTIDFRPMSSVNVVGLMGSGKSRISEAVLFGLTGARTLRSLGAFVRRGTNECRVVETFAIGTREYRTTRTVSLNGRKATSTLELAQCIDGRWEPEGSGVKDTEERLRAILGRDERTILLTNFIGQRDAGAFFELDPAERLESVGKIVRTNETYTPIELYFKGKADEVRPKIEGARRELERLETDLAQLDGRKADLADAADALYGARADLAQHEEDLKAAEKRAREAQDGLKTAATARERLRELEAQRGRLTARETALQDERQKLTDRIDGKAELEQLLATRADLETAVAALAEAERADAETRQKRAVLDTLYRKHDEALQRINSQGVPKKAELERLNKQATNLTERITAIEQAETPVCDRCGQPIADAALARTLDQLVRERTDVDLQATTLAAEIEELRAIATTESGSKKAALADISALPPLTYDLAEDRRLKGMLERVSEVPAKLAEITACEERLGTVAGEMDTLRAEIEDPKLRDALAQARAAVTDAETNARAATEADLEVTRLTALVDRGRQTISELEKSHARHEEAIAMLDRSRQRAEEIRTAMRADEQDLADAELLRRHFGKYGVPRLIVGNVLAALEVHVNQILASYDSGFSMRFATEKETSDGATRDSLEILVDDGEHEAPFEEFSGGEKYQVASSLRLGLAELLSHRSGFPLETVIVDEPEGLDANGRAYLAKILERLSASVPLVMLLSHHEDLQEALPSRIMISRDGRGPSRVEVLA